MDSDPLVRAISSLEDLWASALAVSPLTMDDEDVHTQSLSTTASPPDAEERSFVVGQCYSWGKSSSFQLGRHVNDSPRQKADASTADEPPPPKQEGLDLTRSHTSSPILIASLCSKPISMVAAGQSHSLALDARGMVYAWGDSTCGQLGHGDMTPQKYPKIVDFFYERDSVVTCIAAGQSHSMAVTAAGSAYAFGSNELGQLGLPQATHEDRFGTTTLSSGASMYVLPTILSKLDDKGILVASVVAGFHQSVLITRKGRAILCGSLVGSGLKLIRGIEYATTRVVGAACSRMDTILLTDDGGVWGCGTRPDTMAAGKTIHFPREGVCISRVSAGMEHFLALDTDGFVYGWGSNAWGQLGIGQVSRKKVKSPIRIEMAEWSDMRFADISCGWQYSMVITRNHGECYAFGCGAHGQLGTGNLLSIPHATLVLNLHSCRTLRMACGEAHTLAIASGYSSSQHFSNLLECEEYSDVHITLHWNDDRWVIPAHAPILAARCAHMRNVLSCAMAPTHRPAQAPCSMDGYTDTIPRGESPSISLNLPYGLFRHYLEYLYTDNLSNEAVPLDSTMLHRLSTLGDALGHTRMSSLAHRIADNDRCTIVPSSFKKDIAQLLSKKGCGRWCSDFSIEVYRVCKDAHLTLEKTFLPSDRLATIHAHKCILHRVEYYRAMFGFMSDKSSLMIVRKDDISPSAMKQIMWWMYSHSIDFTPDTVMEVLEAALVYHFPQLLQLAVNYVEDRLDGTNALSFLAIAVNFHLSHLLHFAMSFVAKHFDECVANEQDVWDDVLPDDVKDQVLLRRPAQMVSLAQLHEKKMKAALSQEYRPSRSTPIRGAGSVTVRPRDHAYPSEMYGK